MKIIFVILVLFLLNVIDAESIGKQRYCSKRQVRQVIEATCTNGRSNQKRAFFPSTELFDRRDRNLLWRNLFNIKDNTTVTIPEASFQLNLLFGHCDEERKELDLKNLLDMYKNEDYSNDRLINNNYLNYGSNYDQANAYKSLMGFRKKRGGISDECCSRACSLTQLMDFCPD